MCIWQAGSNEVVIPYIIIYYGITFFLSMSYLSCSKVVLIISIVTLNKGVGNNLAYVVNIHRVATYPFGFP